MNTPLTLDSSIWNDDNKLRRVFSWLTRIGAAPKFGSRPIGWYQQDQCKAIEKLETLAKAKAIQLEGAPVRFSKGCFEAKQGAKWIMFARFFAYQIVPA